MMRVLISGEGNHEPAGQHYMSVDNHGFLIDLSEVQGTLHDPTIARAEWGKVIEQGQPRDGGTIVQRDGHRQRFFDQALLKPYLDAYAAQRARLEAMAALPAAQQIGCVQ